MKRFGSLPAEDVCDFQVSDTRIVLADEQALAEPAEGAASRASRFARSGVSFVVLQSAPEYLAESSSSLVAELAVQCGRAPPHAPQLAPPRVLTPPLTHLDAGSGISVVFCDSDDAVARFLHSMVRTGGASPVARSDSPGWQVAPIQVRPGAVPGPHDFAAGPVRALQHVPNVGERTATHAVAAGGRGLSGVCAWVARDTELGAFLHRPLSW